MLLLLLLLCSWLVIDPSTRAFLPRTNVTWLSNSALFRPSLSLSHWQHKHRSHELEIKLFEVLLLLFLPILGKNFKQEKQLADPIGSFLTRTHTKRYSFPMVIGMSWIWPLEAKETSRRIRPHEKSADDCAGCAEQRSLLPLLLSSSSSSSSRAGLSMQTAVLICTEWVRQMDVCGKSSQSLVILFHLSGSFSSSFLRYYFLYPHIGSNTK